MQGNPMNCSSGKLQGCSKADPEAWIETGRARWGAAKRPPNSDALRPLMPSQCPYSCGSSGGPQTLERRHEVFALAGTRYIRLVRFSFLILIGRFATLEP